MLLQPPAFGSLAGRLHQGPDNEQKAATLENVSHSLTHSFIHQKLLKATLGSLPGHEIGAGWELGGCKLETIYGITVGDPRNAWILPFTAPITTSPEEAKEQEQRRKIRKHFRNSISADSYWQSTPDKIWKLKGKATDLYFKSFVVVVNFWNALINRMDIYK